MNKFWKEYWVEIILLILIIAVLFLLFEPFGFRGVLRGSLTRSATAGVVVSKSLFDKIVNFLLSLSMIDLLGLVLVIGLLVLVAARIRIRFLNDPAKDSTVCPNCGSRIQRVHRTWFDRLLGKTLLPNSRRYRCENEACRWSGLRHPRHRSERSVPEGNISQVR